MATTHVVTEHVDLVSTKDFEATVRGLEAALGNASPGELMQRLAASDDWDDYAAQCAALAGSSGLIQVGHLDWGGVLSLSGVAMKARCFIVGNPLTAQKLLATGGPQAGLYLPAKVLVFEDAKGSVHLAYDTFVPIMAPFGIEALDRMAAKIDDVLDGLVQAAAG
ncbi:DUF302 domain-containing protein [Sphingopyxis alaskensis]|jgi:uncharacterized protein (DUF302 family)|uniref:DUF302 domain-containing protein n=1 Tax=Sphingopyxis alaskensis TaxID=117207 RepID=UPI00204062F5|nr:DUF302 domain-containing protein [Sphingopyxis alaskensis]MCM3419769.1 DUF302 domain-containing protein [Sphingopyxis alaskensis]